jgi:methylthioribose-1-phosphate isomerase
MNEFQDSELARRPRALIWRNRRLLLLDQTRLPEATVWLRPDRAGQVIRAIKRLAVRGAPLIGVAGAFGLALEAQRFPKRARLLYAARAIKSARPTAVNLAWAVERLERIVRDEQVEEHELAQALAREAEAILAEEAERSMRIARYGVRLIRDGFNILTICNTGWLAAPGLGTALAAIYAAHAQGKHIMVYVPETRPLLQGARLTAFELNQAGVPCTVLTDSMIATIMPEVDLVLVGADRIARNGDFANKIGTYQMALLARQFHRPFYTVAPVTTFDFSARSGKDIPIEYRDSRELMFCGSQPIAPPGVGFHNPAFDVTPARLLTGIVTDQGILRFPLTPAIARLREKKGEE